MHATPQTVEPRRWWALGAVSLAVLVVGIDGTVLSVALPTLAVKLHASESDLQWFSSSYLLVLAAAMLPASLLGDRYGRRRLLLGALALFGLGSAACAASTTSAEFIAARVWLGAAGAGVMVMALSALTVLFSEAERPKAVGVWSAASFMAFPIGPIVGGWLLTHAWWGWVFLLNVPVAVLGALATQLLIPESRAVRPPAFDPLGMASSVGGLLAITFGLIEAGQHGWGDPAGLGSILAGTALLVAFAAWQRRLGARADRAPLVDPELFRSRSYAWGVILVAVLVIAMMGVLFTMPQYFQGVAGTDALGSGVRLLALVGGLVAGALPAATMARALGDKATIAAGFMLLSAGLAVGASTTVTTSATFVALWMALVGAGTGVAMATASSAALSELDEEHGAIGSAVLQAVNKTGAPLGTAVLGSILASGYLARLRLSGLAPAAAHAARQSIFGAVAVAQRLHAPALLHAARAAFVHGMAEALLVSSGIGAAGVLLAVMFMPRDASRGAVACPDAADGDVAAGP